MTKAKIKNVKQFVNESNNEPKESKWFNRLKTYEREYLSKKYPMSNDFNSFDEWVIYVYNSEKLVDVEDFKEALLK